MSVELIEHNPMLKKPIMRMLSLLSQTATANRPEIERQARASWESGFHASPAATIDILVRNGAIDQAIVVNGEPYDGTLDDASMDADLPDDAVAETMVSITELGERILSEYDPAHQVEKLFTERPHYAEVYLEVLRLSANPKGATRDEIERTIGVFPQLKPDELTNQTKVYPQYFLDALETAGAIAWDGTWRITDAGREKLLL